MSLFVYIVLFATLGSVISLAGGVLLLSVPKFIQKISHFLTAFAAGALLGGTFFDLLPEALHEGYEIRDTIFLYVLLGFLSFFILERFLRWFHWHDEQVDHEEKHPVLPLLIVGDSVHNFIDGAAIAAAFMVNIPLGIATSFAVASHEIPQEIGDFGIMLKHNMKPLKVILINVISALFALVGAILILILGDLIEGYLPILLALTSGFFIYVAASDLIPEIHHEKRKGFAIYESGFLLFGILFLYSLSRLFNHS